jgi:hypothetical protein
MKFFRSGSYATVTSTAALVLALGGTSYAASQITGSDIKAGTVGKAQLAGTALVTAKSVHNDNGTNMDGSTKTVLSLDLAKGQYVINSKVAALGNGNNSYASCFLVAPNGTVKDTSWWWAGSAVTGYGTLANQAVMKLGHENVISLKCFGGTSTLYYKKLTAVKVATVTDLTGVDVAKAGKPATIRPKG